MRYIILSDIHSNLPALEACLAEAERAGGFGAALVLGDLVGYASQPNETISRLRNLGVPVTFIRGNHDKAAAGLEDCAHFQKDARDATLWTRRVLTLDHSEFLKNLPKGPVFVEDHIELAHGSPAGEDIYLIRQDDVRDAFEAAQREVCFFGHTHLPMVIALRGRAAEVHMARRSGEGFPLSAGGKYLVNPGSVGQPRDQNPMASCALYDSEKREATFLRAAYPVETVQDMILEAGLPVSMARRLSHGV